MARLILEATDDHQEIKLRPVNTLGRHPSNSIQLLDKIVSKQHCVIEQRGEQFVLRDLQSSNGTFINRVRVRGDAVLEDGDEIMLGFVRARYVVGEAPGPAPAPPPLKADVITAPSGEEVGLASTLVGEEEVESGMLILGHHGDIWLRLWNVDVREGGFMIRVPLGRNRPADSSFATFSGKSEREVLVCSRQHPAFVQLLEWLRPGLLAATDVQAWVGGFCHAVFDVMGGKLSRRQVVQCETEAQRFRGQQVDIGHFLQAKVGVCRHRSFLFHHLAEALGLSVLTHRGTVPGGRHAWNELRLEGKRIFVDTTLDMVLGDARQAEHARGYEASREFPMAPQNKRDPSMMLVLGEVETQFDDIRLDYEVRKAPSGEEVVLLIYPERDLQDTRFLYSHVRAWGAKTDPNMPLFAMPPPITMRVYAITGDFAEPLMDGVEPGALGGRHG